MAIFYWIWGEKYEKSGYSWNIWISKWIRQPISNPDRDDFDGSLPAEISHTFPPCPIGNPIRKGGYKKNNIPRHTPTTIIIP